MAEQVSYTNFEKTYTVTEISKTQVGRVILKECGNEGTQDSDQKANLRRFLQSVIDNFKEVPSVCGNAEIRVSDNFGYSVRIVSGNGEYKYVVLMNGNGEIELIQTGSPPAWDILKTANSQKTYTVMEISKIHVKRVILQECGNAGTQDSEKKSNLRRLLQGVIDNFIKGPDVRRNAEIRVSDNFGYSLRIVSGNGENKYVVLMNGSGEIELRQTGSPPAWDIMKTANFERTYTVMEISKTNVERVILKECGNEGPHDSEKKANLRRLLQGVIDNFKEGPSVCGNAEIRVSDNFSYSVRIVSRKGAYKYVVLMNGSGEIELIQTGSPTAWDKMKTTLSNIWEYVYETVGGFLNTRGVNS